MKVLSVVPHSGFIPREHVESGLKAQQLLSQRPDSPAVPIETLKRFAFVVRIGTAQKLGMYPPMALMDYAEFR